MAIPENNPDADWIVHICPREEWEAAQVRGEYRDASLEDVGFIHFSRPDQILTVANEFYRGVYDLVILWVDPQKVDSELRWERVNGGIFPHLYGPLNLDAVLTVRDFPPDADGTFQSVPD